MKKKEKFDTSAFVFNTPLEKIEEALQRLYDQDADPLAEPFTLSQLYWMGIWQLHLPDAKKRGLKEVPTCAQEAAALGLYDKPVKKKRKKSK